MTRRIGTPRRASDSLHGPTLVAALVSELVTVVASPVSLAAALLAPVPRRAAFRRWAADFDTNYCSTRQSGSGM